MFKVIIAGGRDFAHYDFLRSGADQLLALKDHNIIEIVSGTAKGADQLGEQYARENGFALTRMPAQWDKFGKSAGYKRNVQMAEYADALIACWDGKSRGTMHMINIATERKLPTRIITY